MDSVRIKLDDFTIEITRDGFPDNGFWEYVRTRAIRGVLITNEPQSQVLTAINISQDIAAFYRLLSAITIEELITLLNVVKNLHFDALYVRLCSFDFCNVATINPFSIVKSASSHVKFVDAQLAYIGIHYASFVDD